MFVLCKLKDKHSCQWNILEDKCKQMQVREAISNKNNLVTQWKLYQYYENFSVFQNTKWKLSY